MALLSLTADALYTVAVKSMLSSPWMAVTLAIIGLAIGYTAVIVRQGTPALAAGSYCPRMATCAKGECDEAVDCADGSCDGHCPGCPGENV